MAAVMRHDRPLLFALGAVLVLVALLVQQRITPGARVLTQKDIDKAVLHTLATKPIPSAAARAYENVRPSLVRVRGMVPGDDGKMIEGGVGSGVVIVESGMILTNLHVVSQAKELRVVFHDGTEAGADLVSAQPEHDLAVIRAKLVPDDMKPATLRSTGDLLPGDRVVAAGFPFGIGPSVSEGVVSGLKREFRSADGSRKLTNLIQFDAAANPGSSGGPLVTMDGEVVGIVTAILNPSEQRVFIGIGFAVSIENAASGVGVHPF
jgi:S1-C subfamily serine protease